MQCIFGHKKPHLDLGSWKDVQLLRCTSLPFRRPSTTNPLRLTTHPHSNYHTHPIVILEIPDHDRPPILPPHLRPILPLPLRQILHRLRSRQHRLPRRNHRHLHRFLPAAVFLPQPARSVRNPSAGGRIVRSCRRFFSRFGRISCETMAGHCDFMREAVRIQG